MKLVALDRRDKWSYGFAAVGLVVGLVVLFFPSYHDDHGGLFLRTDFITLLILLLSGSGFLFWPICALLWRGRRATSALRWVFLAQLACNLVLAGFALLSNINLELAILRDWISVSIILNLLFAPIALVAAIYDFNRWANISPSEWRDTLHSLKDDYSNRLADRNLIAEKRAELEWLLKQVRKMLGNRG